jgi:ATP adenylyltransferase
MENCEFCLEFSSFKKYKLSFFHSLFPHLSNRILKETENFVVVPSLGQISEGYLLVITKDHYISMGHLPPQLHDELNIIIEQVSDILQFAYNKDIIQFEHGPSSSSQKGGCCIDHAHLHILPLNVLPNLDLLPDLIFREKHETNLFPAIARDFLDNNRPYLYIKIRGSSINRSFTLDAVGLPSQYMRRIIAQSIGKYDEWDWAIFIGEQEVEYCLKKLQPLFTQLEERNV